MGSDLHFYFGLTLVDITATGVTRFRPEQEMLRDQQRNWETVIQTLGLRCQPMHLSMPVCREMRIDAPDHIFGEMYSGVHKVWYWEWASEHADVYLQGDAELGGLLHDFEQVPIINGLTESARFLLPIFHPYGGIKNIHFEVGTLNF